MFGEGFKLQHIIEAIYESQCATISVGTHHYVQLSESDVLKNADPKKLESIELLFPAGAAVPSSCEEIYKAKMKNLKFVMNGYGMSEVGVLTINNTSTAIGYVLPGNTFKVRI